MRRVFALGLVLACVACGSRTDVRRKLDAGAPPQTSPELCNGLDDDAKNGVDDGFRDALGRYVTDDHCGACNQPCSPRNAQELEAHCALVDEVPRCVANRCAPGFGPTREGRCVALSERLCLPCAQDADCGNLRNATCTSIGGESRCSVSCSLGCPQGYRCDAMSDLCVPEGGSCSCDSGDTFEVACAVDVPNREPGAPVCVGRARCASGTLSKCVTQPEICDEADNDCDGKIDNGFRDERGAYSLDAANCGQCGTSCVEDTGTEFELMCGGDPFAPSCVLACPDARDGIGPGDKLDGDLQIGSGCECTVSALADEPGPLAEAGELLDVNCDGADGVVVESLYVAPDGDDTWPGSPTRPLRTISAAIERARTSLTTERPRPHVFVASGSYTETLSLADGVRIHGGYRRDFRALDPASYLVEVRAPALTLAPGGAALVASEVGEQETRVEWLSLRGLDASAPERATVGMYLDRPKKNLVLRGLVVRAGVPGEGRPGADGAAGTGPMSEPAQGQVPQVATEDARHQCVAGSNVGQGGAGGINRCGNSDVSGGAGGSSGCPKFSERQGGGSAGAAGGGAGGAGGQDSSGPIVGGLGCDKTVCCGLADFTVPNDFQGPRSGENGRVGTSGQAGSGCQDPRGSFLGDLWAGSRGNSGTDGQPGAGGGGGGAGGGVEMGYRRGECEFADGLGGGGGGGGAGGCGGRGGSAGSSGAPSLAMLVISPAPFTVEDVTLMPADGGRGGAGGVGGDGGQGGVGAFGGSLPPSALVIPSLAGTFPGARGGSGGAGGAGGGGGGGCGGASVGIWVVGGAPDNLDAWRNRNRFDLGAGGEGGLGGGGAQAGSRGARGEAANVVVQP